MPKNNGQLMPVKDALKVIPVSREAFYRKLQTGELPSYRLGRRILVDIEECKEAMRQKKDASQTTTN